MNKTLSWMIAAILTIFGIASAYAQKIKTIDTEGNPVGYASIINAADGKMIGYTNLDGEFVNSAEVPKITVTHVAFNTKTVDVASLTDGIITLEDSDWGLSEIVVKPKDFIYVQTYYRVIYMEDDTLLYYRAGVTDNTYDIAKKKASSSHSHFSKSSMGLLKFLMDRFFGGILDGYSDINPESPCVTKKGKGKFTYTQETPTRFRVDYNGKRIGNMVDDVESHQRRIAIDNKEYMKIIWAEKAENASEKKRKKLEARMESREESQKNRNESRYTIYELDDEGNCGVEDLIARELKIDYDKYSKYNKKYEHIRIWVEVFATDRAYVDKKDLKELKRNNKVDMKYADIQQFEKSHDIPAMPENAHKALVELLNKKEKK